MWRRVGFNPPIRTNGGLKPTLQKTPARAGVPQSLYRGSLNQRQIHSALAAVPAGLQLVADLLVVRQCAQARLLQRADVHEHALAAVFRCGKAVAFSFVEPFHGASGHPVVS